MLQLKCRLVCSHFDVWGWGIIRLVLVCMVVDVYLAVVGWALLIDVGLFDGILMLWLLFVGSWC